MAVTETVGSRWIPARPVCWIAAVLLATVGSAMELPDDRSKTAFRELQLGYVALDTGDLEGAMEHYHLAREMAVGDEQLFQAHFGFGSAALELDRLDEARRAFEAAHALRPGEVGATLMLGVTCRRQGDLDIAVRYLAEAAAGDPGLTQALVELAIAYAELERHADAERICREVLELEPDNIEARLGLAVALFHRDKNELAVDEFRRVLEADPKNVRAHYGLGLALVFADDRQGALDELRYLNQHAPELGDELFGWIYPDP
jgi:tetratricopeptide (TPR) repeat protein